MKTQVTFIRTTALALALTLLAMACNKEKETPTPSVVGEFSFAASNSDFRAPAEIS